jgi:glycosyltransferase involved in cell wall biosynthesis
MTNNRQYDISIITPTLNAVGYLQKCLESVSSQRAVSVQHIIVDGGSIDGTIEMVKNSSAELLVVPGSSIYVAHNEAIKHVRAPILGALNADDVYSSAHALAKVIETRSKLNNIGVIYGNCTFVDSAGNELYRLVPPRKLTPKGASLRVMNISHPSWFIDTECMNQLGCYDTSLRFIADCDLIIRAVRQGVEFTNVDFSFANFTLHENNASRSRAAYDEHLHYFRHINGSSPIKRILHTLSLVQLYSRDLRYFFYRMTRYL